MADSTTATLVSPRDDIHDIPEMLTTTSAASALGVTRRGLMKLIQSGALDHISVGTHQRFLAADVIALRDRLASQR